MADNFCDVIIIGAGISGLIAAKELTGKGVNVIVLEARDRIGGRTYTIKNSKVNYCDLGGSYVGNTQKNIVKVIEELGLKTYKINEKEDLLYYRNKKRIRFSSDQFLPSVGLIEYLDLKYMFRLIDKMGEEIPAEAPWNAPHAQQWDTITVKQFLDQNLWTDLARNFITKIFVQMSVTAEPYECSLLWFLWYVKQCGGSKIIHSTTNGAQERKIIGGSMQICEKLVEIIGTNKVVTNKPVVGINQTNNNIISVSTLDGSEYNANYVILALPPPMQQRIHFNPPLSPLRSQLNQRCPMGSVIKCIIYYKTTFWRDKGFCGSILMDGFVNECPIQYTYDDTKHDGSFPAIVGFITTDYARQLLLISKKERLKLICESIAKALNCEEANHPIHYEEYNWLADQYSGGGFTTICGPGFLTRYAKIIRQPIDRLYFAGTETATEWSGYMDGAIQAGKRAAKEIMQALGKLPNTAISIKSNV